ncbi:hypothetical protein A8709_20970 [Paenibacillus pectinilyticus]|uniref:F5/8 type C domain-containing protein n=1 Tax=Paenibacillus pectinilyticus TaxID=512399 RepID=A0A1C0ZXH7_9BACL|nr:discoidin domain-containing protein [Paenibacillus pectinilyticus]OCT12814.1 hypothetical protein A8709_20970 [Paenibacillus pectinilyticus]
MKRFRILLLALLLILPTQFIHYSALAAGTNSENTTYVLPIWEGSDPSHGSTADLAVLTNMKTRLGTGGTYTKLGWSFSSWALSRETNSSSSDYTFDPTKLNYNLGLAVSANLPILVHMNDGRWADCCTPNSSGGWGDALLDHIAASPNTVMTNHTGGSLYAHNYGSNYFSLSRYNSVYINYKKRNIQSSASTIAAWANAHPTLFAGVSLDSETVVTTGWDADYSTYSVAEWKDWLQNTGIYGPGGSYFGQGRVPAFTTIGSFNTAMGTSFASWAAVTPPTSVTVGNAFSEEWSRWRVVMVEHHVADVTSWITASGIDRNLIYGHQTPELDYYNFADDIRTATAANGGSGITFYGWVPATMGKVSNRLRGAGSNNVGNFEVNPLSSNATTAYNTMVTMFNDGYKIICPNSWEDLATKDQYAIFGSPNYGDTFGNAISSFLTNYGNTQRNKQPVPWNPGNKIYDFYANFAAATKSGVDNHLEPNGSVGNAQEKSIQSQVPGMITYTVALPSVPAGERLNFRTDIGIKDGTGGFASPGPTFQVAVNGSTLFGDSIQMHETDYVWHRWQEVMVDVTPWAGSTVTVSFQTGGPAAWGWAYWGAPAIYQTTSTTNNLAAGHTVAVSSTDGVGAGWDATYLVDGNVQGGTNGRNGWSSTSSPSNATNQWATVDLGSQQSVGKVVLFPRSDISNAASTGFPIDFQIQGSNDGSTFTNIVSETNYPDAVAGKAQIFTFIPQTYRYIRVNATKLNGVAQESGYRFQLTEMQIFN